MTKETKVNLVILKITFSWEDLHTHTHSSHMWLYLDTVEHKEEQEFPVLPFPYELLDNSSIRKKKCIILFPLHSLFSCAVKEDFTVLLN